MIGFVGANRITMVSDPLPDSKPHAVSSLKTLWLQSIMNCSKRKKIMLLRHRWNNVTTYNLLQFFYKLSKELGLQAKNEKKKT